MLTSIAATRKMPRFTSLRSRRAAKRKYMDCDARCGSTGIPTTPFPSDTGTNIIAWQRRKGRRFLKNARPKVPAALDDCIERFSASRKEELGEKTAAAYRFQLDRLPRLCGNARAFTLCAS